MTPQEAALLLAHSQVGVSECPPGSNAGPKVEQYLGTVGLGKGNPWCAAFAVWAVLEAGPLGAVWPLPLSGSCQALYEAAKAHGLVRVKPAAGDLFLLWFESLKRFAHIGFVVAVNPDGSLETIEGNTNPSGGREGWIVARRRRTLGPKDRVIAWA